LVQELQIILEKEPIRAVFCEIPCNPLLRTVDLPEVSRLCRAAGVPLIVDDTIGTVHNVDVYPYADLVTTSLTKTISGVGDVMAGAVWVAEGSPYREELRQFFARDRGAPLFGEDAEVLLKNSEDFPARMRRINANAEALVSALAKRPEIERLYYPTRETPPLYERLRRPEGGYGGLFSMTLRGGEVAARRFYDALRVSKGPSLGTDFTLVCPYTLLAHYEELEWAASCGVRRDLIRVSVGTEPAEDLIERFVLALDCLAL
jgi:cystathionine gamma-synthase